jgi:macrolide glycosyltransferase
VAGAPGVAPAEGLSAMAHLVMVAGAGHGHVNPNLPVVAELVARGHRVDYAVPERFAELVAGTGATPLVHTSVLPHDARRDQWPADPIAGMGLFLDEGVHVLPQLERMLDGARPDLFLADIGGYPARVLAQRWGVPLVQLSPAIVAWDGYEDDTPEVAALFATPEGEAYLERFAAWLDGEGVPEDPLAFTGRPPRSIVLVPRLLQPHAERVDPARYAFVGPCLDARPHEEPWPAPSRPLVLVSLGSAYTDEPDFFRVCAEAFGDGGHEVVLAIGATVDPAALGPLPSGVTAHRWVPQWSVLAHASLFVTHAGMGGCSEGLWHGVPMVAVPRAADQFGNAAMLAEAGVATVVDLDDVVAGGAEVLREAWRAVDSPEVAARCAAASADLRSGGGASRAADLVEAELL